jgi:GNAT superfamily N-acetyltransferase
MQGIDMFKMYNKERLGYETLVTDKGFATFEIEADAGEVYIVDIYVLPEHRKSGEASKMSEAICLFAKKSHGCNSLRGTVDFTLPTASDSMAVLLAHGMKFSHIDDSLMVFIKEI